MFEKEVDEMAVNNAKRKYGLEGSICMNIQECSYVNGFQDGAEFGYNKANEWHYLKDGDLPKKTDEYLVYIINGYGCKSIELIQYNNGRHFWCVDCQNDVIAWKEIVLPEIKESE